MFLFWTSYKKILTVPTVLSVICLIGCAMIPVKPGKQIPPSLSKKTCLDFKKIEHQLLKGRIMEIKRIEQVVKNYRRFHENSPLILFYTNNLKAIFKPERGRKAIFSSLKAYEFSRLMGFDFVPPTVLRTINGKTGTVQFWIDSKPLSPKEKQKILRALPVDLKTKIYIFYFLLGIEDILLRHILIDKKCNTVMLIDNENWKEISISNFYDLPFALHAGFDTLHKININDIKKFPFNKVKSVNNNSLSALKAVAGEYLEKELKEIFFCCVVQGKLRAHRRMDNKIYYIKWKGGLWIQHNGSGVLTYNLFDPLGFSISLINKLAMLSYKKLFDRFSAMPYFENKNKVGKNIDHIKLILHRRDVLLEEIQNNYGL